MIFSRGPEEDSSISASSQFIDSPKYVHVSKPNAQFGKSPYRILDEYRESAGYRERPLDSLPSRGAYSSVFISPCIHLSRGGYKISECRDLGKAGEDQPFSISMRRSTLCRSHEAFDTTPQPRCGDRRYDLQIMHAPAQSRTRTM